MNRLATTALLGALLPLTTGGGVAAQQAQAAALANPLAAQSLEGLSATRERPLFSAQRRPPAPARLAAAPPPPPPTPPQPPQVALYGIVTEPDGARAMVHAGGDKIIGVRVGDDLSGWRVTKIERRKVELALGGRTVSFVMFSSNVAVAGMADSDNAKDDTADAPQRRR